MLYAGLLFRFRENIQQFAGADVKFLEFLFENYNKDCFMYEVIDSVRRISLTGLLVFFPERVRSAGGVVLAFFFCLLHEKTNPYKEKMDNFVASVANMCA